jgi:hypothetical protein
MALLRLLVDQQRRMEQLKLSAINNAIGVDEIVGALSESYKKELRAVYQRRSKWAEAKV